MSLDETKIRGIEPAGRLTMLQVVTLILSVYVLLALIVQSTVQLTPATVAFLDRIDFFVCIVFLTDFFVRLVRAPSKTAFLKWGWVDFISSIPMFDALRFGRIVRVVRIFRVLRAFRSTKNLLTYFLRDRPGASIAAVTALSFMLVVFCAMAMLQFETSPDANIKTPDDAFWWAYVTVTTAGYGDKYPLSSEGRVVACILMTAGVGLFSIITGFVASMFVDPEIKREDSDIKLLTAEIRVLGIQVKALESKLDDRKN